MTQENKYNTTQSSFHHSVANLGKLDGVKFKVKDFYVFQTSDAERTAGKKICCWKVEGNLLTCSLNKYM